MNAGHVYFLVNPSMPGLIKIGFTTTSLHQRLEELETTGVPEPFVIGAAFLVSDAQLCEQRLHELFNAKRKTPKREFFELVLAEALIESMPIIQDLMTSDNKNIVFGNNVKTKSLTFEESEMLSMLVHRDNGEPISAEDVAREHGIHIQKVLLGCAKLIDMGLIQENRYRNSYTNNYSLTHKGRKYCFDHGIVIKEIIDAPL